jgi:CubicO group peptidase (beta-lactamase class C family)
VNVAAATLVTIALGMPAVAADRSPRISLEASDARPAIDGHVDDAEWRGATVLGPLELRGGTEDRDHPTDVRVRTDGRTLFVAVRAGAPSIERLADSARDAARVWSDDWVAIAIDPQDRGFGAYFFLLNPRGIRSSGALGADGKPRALDAMTWAGAAARTSDGYAAEFAIPLDDLPYGPGPVQFGVRAVRYVAAGSRELGLPAPRDDAPDYVPMLLQPSIPSRYPDGRARRDLELEFAAKRSAIRATSPVTLEQRVASYGDASVLDYEVFPKAPIAASPRPFVYPRMPRTAAAEALLAGLEYAPGRRVGDVRAFLRDTQTTSLIVVKDGAVVYERYLNGFSPHSTFTSFSTAKSFVSTLVGIAIDRGLIRSELDPVTRYVPELVDRDAGFANVRIADLLHMASGIAYEEQGPVRDDQRTYMDPNLRRAALEHTRLVEPPNTAWHYNNYNPLLLGLVLERASHMSITAFTERYLWNPLGMESAASWSLDSHADRFEKMESGLNGSAIDFAKLGSLYLSRGLWRGERVLSERWIDEATTSRAEGHDATQRAGGSFYGYFWWLKARPGAVNDYYALGNKGQYIFVSPARRIVIVRTGLQYGLPAQAWPALLQRWTDRLSADL